MHGSCRQLSKCLLHTCAPSVRASIPLSNAINHHQVLEERLPQPCQPPQARRVNAQLPPPPPGSNYTPVTPVDPDRLLAILSHSPYARELYEGFKFGFCIPHVPSPWSHPIRNHKSVLQNPQFMDAYIARELSAGRIVGPFASLPPHCIVSPLGLVPKSEPGTFRVIHDLSFPKGWGVNDLIPNNLTSVSYKDFEHVSSLVRQAGEGSLIAKVDIQNAFRIMLIHLDDIHLFGFHWHGQFYLDKCLPIGYSLSCTLFERFSSSLQEALISKFGFSLVSHILDDFIFLSPANSPLCQFYLRKFLCISKFVGIPIKDSKTVLPSTCVPIHGIQVDTLHMEARLPQDKLLRLLDLVSSFARRRTAKVRMWQSLLGHLSFACRVFNVLRGRSNPNHYVRIPQSVRSDCVVWRCFLLHFNGVSMMIPLAPLDSDRILLFSDASACGCAATFGQRWFQLGWGPAWVGKHINVKEFVPIFLALDTWGCHLRHSAITFHCDNQAVVEVINSGTTRDPDMLVILRALTLLSLHLDINICALHLPGKLNQVADCLSRMQVTPEFLAEAGLYEAPTPLCATTRTSMQL